MSGQNQNEPGKSNDQFDVKAGISWLGNIGSLTAALFRLAFAELSLAREDLGRLILVILLIVPMFLLTWMAFSVLAAWIAFELTGSATLGFVTFAAIQLLTSLILRQKYKTYRHTLSLPATRAQILMIFDEVRHETSKSNPSDRDA